MSMLVIENGVVIGGPQTPYIRSLLNTYVGDYVGDKNTTGNFNTAVGTYALNSNTTGYYNSAVGAYALYSNITGYVNLALGADALYFNTIGYWNIAVGTHALYSNTTGYDNLAVGTQALFSNITGHDNIAVGSYALYSNTGSYSLAVGKYALYKNTTGSDNLAVGTHALYSNTTGSDNLAVGKQALFYNTIGHRNSAFGAYALSYIVGDYHNNVAVGDRAGSHQADGTNLTTPSQSVYIGSWAMGFNNSDVNSIVIGYRAKGIGANTVVLGNDNITITALKGKVGIGTVTPNANALLDIVSTTKAVMFPRMTTAQRDAIATPTEGMLIYNLTTHIFNFYAEAAWGAI